MGEGPIRHIGILTGGGDCPGLDAVIRAVVKPAIPGWGWDVIGIEKGLEGLGLPDGAWPLHLSSVRGILPRGSTIPGTTSRTNPFAYPAHRLRGA